MDCYVIILGPWHSRISFFLVQEGTRGRSIVVGAVDLSTHEFDISKTWRVTYASNCSYLSDMVDFCPFSFFLQRPTRPISPICTKRLIFVFSLLFSSTFASNCSYLYAMFSVLRFSLQLFLHGKYTSALTSEIFFKNQIFKKMFFGRLWTLPSAGSALGCVCSQKPFSLRAPQASGTCSSTSNKSTPQLCPCTSERHWFSKVLYTDFL